MSRYQPGDLLIAPPTMADPRFRNSVLLITQDGDQGTQGLCINKPAGHQLNDVISSLGIELPEDPVMFWGGPVGVNTVWMLHEATWSSENTMIINDQWSMTSSMNMFEEVAKGNSPKHFRVMIGLSTWAPGQLDSEMDGTGPFTIESSWLIAHAPGPDIMFTGAVRDMWHDCCELAGSQAVSHWLD